MENFEDYKNKGRRSSGRPDRSGQDRRFQDRRNLDRSSSRRDFRPRDPKERNPHTVKCDACGESCEVPFKPTPGKPVYCDNCFKKNKSSNPENVSSKGLDEVNEKLDKILALLRQN